MASAQRRDDDLARAFTTIAGSFERGFGVIDMLHTVAAECARVLDISDVGIVLTDGEGVLNIVAATSERTAVVELFQLESGSGPCFRAYITGVPVSIPRIEHATGADLFFRDSALGQGFQSAYATPLRAAKESVGALNLFSAHDRSLSYSDELVADAFARIAAVTLLAHRQNSPAGAGGTAEALEARSRIEHAKGLLGGSADLSPDEAFRRMRAHSLATGIPLGDVARALVHRVLRL
jgi:hypothetical protein